MAVAVAPKWKARRQRVFQSVFPTDIAPSLPGHGHPHDPPRLDDHPHSGLGGQSAAAADRPRTLRRQGQQAQDATTSALFSNHAPTLSDAGSQPQPLPPPLFPSLPEQDQSGAAEQQTRFDRAWHVVTSYIALPSLATTDNHSLGPLDPSRGLGRPSEGDFFEALALVVGAQTLLPHATHTDVVEWHTRQVRRHFAQHVLPLAEGRSGERKDGRGEEAGRMEREERSDGQETGSSYQQHMALVMSSVRTLESALRLYSDGLQLIVRGLQKFRDADTPDPQLVAARFRRDVHALVSNSASPALVASLRVVLVHLVGSVLGVPPQQTQTARPSPPTDDDDDVGSRAARKRLLELLEALHEVGLAGENFQLLFAEVMDGMMTSFVRGAYAGVWKSGDDARREMGSCAASLSDWVENRFARVAVEVIGRVAVDSGEREEERRGVIGLADVKTYQSLALGRLAALRISELFDIVLAWPASRGALDDLRVAVSTPQRRTQLTESFVGALQTRLLHPGRSTLEILQTYISIIRAFHALDHSKVLLARVSPSLQLYLCGREDAVRIVVTGLLGGEAARATASSSHHASSSSSSSGGGNMSHSSRDGNSSTLVELATLLTDPARPRAADEDADLDWNDMAWVPDPIDAGANYKRPRSEDVIGTLISSLGSQDAFIREFQAVVAEHLLSDRLRFDREARVLHLLKKRFGEPALQNCDVMLRDIHESRRLDSAIRGGPRLPGGRKAEREEEEGETSYRARILSRLFWPGLDREHFVLPPPVAERQKHYEQGYQHLKPSRKLTWLNQLGQAAVELELRDRTLAVECKTYEAAVIYAFQDQHQNQQQQQQQQQQAGEDAPTRRSVQELVEQLQMDDDLVASALEFWVSKGALRRSKRGSDTIYTVAETLEETQDEQQDHADTKATGGPSAATLTAGEKEQQARRQMYWQYIRGMLTNASATMALPQVAMMMKMLIADGFPWTDEELQEFLGGKVAEGELEIVGGKYRLAKEK